ncbi:MAG: TspO/MBR family protein [Chitinophagales bacterium]
MIKKILIFLVINFAALGIGGFFTGPGVSSDWYTNLNQAPWTPPGWFFGAAWTTIMICFSFFMAFLYEKSYFKKEIIVLYIAQWILNTIWNPIFFHFQNVLLGLIVISSLTVIVFTFLIRYRELLKAKTLLILPYAVWLAIATSLNIYILLNN